MQDLRKQLEQIENLDTWRELFYPEHATVEDRKQTAEEDRYDICVYNSMNFGANCGYIAKDYRNLPKKEATKIQRIDKMIKLLSKYSPELQIELKKRIKLRL